MYCKKCGKEIADDSVFCQHCGQNLTESIIRRPMQEEKNTKNEAQHTSNSKMVANEVVSNIKMIGLAILLSIVYMASFWLYHNNDRKPISTLSEYGLSCFDEVDMRYYETNWEKIFNQKKIEKTKQEMQYRLLKEQDELNLTASGVNIQKFHNEKKEDIKRLDSIMLSGPAFNLIKLTDDELAIEAKQIASENLDYMINYVNDRREYQFRNAFKEHLKYCILFSLALTIFGRYLVKGIKWVAANKTK